MALSPCAEPGCPILTPTTRCPGHTSQIRKASDAHRPNARQRGYDKRWHTTRTRFLKAMPYCECGAKATDVHHLDGLGPKGPRGHDMLNLKAMCHPCHSKTTATDQPGGFNASR